MHDEQPGGPRGRRGAVVVAVTSTAHVAAWTTGPREHDVVLLGPAALVAGAAGPGVRVLATTAPRWRAVAELLAEQPAAFAKCDAVWFPEADLRAAGDLAVTADLLLALHRELGVALSSPALAPGGPCTQEVSRQHAGFAVRTTTLVEAWAPVFSATALALCAPTFARPVADHGLELAWQSLLARRGGRSAVLDCVPVRRAGEPAPTVLLDGVHPGRGIMGIAAEHGMLVPYAARTTGGLDESYRPLHQSEVSVRCARAVAAWGAGPLDPLDTYRDVVAAEAARAGAVAGTRA